MRRERWSEIQHGEFAYHANKAPVPFKEHKIAYWKALIASLPQEVRTGPDSRMIDVGCGGATVMLALEGDHRFGLDPLIDRYLEQFPYLREEHGITWVDKPAEEVEFDEPFDVVFAMNSFDHVYDPQLAAQRMSDWVRPGGHLVLTMNTHNTSFFRAYYSALYRVIDHHHPYQFVQADVEALFPDLETVEIREIDEMWLEFAEDYYRDVLGRKLVDRKKNWKAARNPFKWPMGFCKLVLNMPPHKKRPGQRSIYSERLFVFRRPPA